MKLAMRGPVSGGKRSFVHHWVAQDNRNPPPNYAIGAGMKLNVVDMDGDRRLDIVAVDTVDKPRVRTPAK